MGRFRKFVRGKALGLASGLIGIQFSVVGADFFMNTWFVDELLSVIVAFLLGRIVWVLKKTEV